MRRALVVVDVQNDFMPDGALPVPEGHEVVPVINRLLDRFDVVVATQDWHPAQHGSFAGNHAGARPGELRDLDGVSQVLWPTHCVQHTPGAEFVDGLDSHHFDAIFSKGLEPSVDSYSGFFDNQRRGRTGLDAYLRSQGVQSVFVCGVATDYCVRFTAEDAHDLGFETFLVEDACRGVNLDPGDVDGAIASLRERGVRIVESEDV
jgi:nicotinamidase/pyrazinamidase